MYIEPVEYIYGCLSDSLSIKVHLFNMVNTTMLMQPHVWTMTLCRVKQTITTYM